YLPVRLTAGGWRLTAVTLAKPEPGDIWSFLMNPISALLAALAGRTAIFVAAWTKAVMIARQAQTGDTNPATDARFPTASQIGIGAVTNFFDTLGIGSFATTTALFRLWRLVPDRIIPGTLNAG